MKRTYLGLGKRSVGVVQFDTMKNKFLVAGDEFQIKFWDMDSVELLTATPADGGLPVTVYSDLNCCWSNWHLKEMVANLILSVFPLLKDQQRRNSAGCLDY